MASTMVALQTVTVGAGGVSSITFSSIPQTYNDLVIKFSARGGAAGSPRFDISFNGSTTLSSGIRLTGNGSAAASSGIPNSPTTGYGGTSGGNDTASTFTNGEIYIPNYTSSNYKSYSVDNVGENNATAALAALVANLWSSTAAITSITLADGSSALQQYSTFTLYGVFNSSTESAPDTPTIGMAGPYTSTSALVAFVPAGTGGTAASYVATSTPGSLTGVSNSSPITVTGLTSGTSYTFTVAAQNPGGISAQSAASNSVTPGTGDFVSLATYAVTAAGGDSSVSFSNIPGGYQRLQLRITNMATATGSNKMTFNGDTASNYRWWESNANGSAASAANSAGLVGYMQPINNASTSYPSATIIDIANYSNGNKVKNIISYNANNINTSNTNNSSIRAGLWNSLAPITSITFAQQSGNIGQYSIYELYGIVG
jgi:hypothetical protein